MIDGGTPDPTKHYPVTGYPEARAFQHELDHLDGRLFVDLLNDAGRMTIKSRLRALEEEFRQKR